MSPKDKFTLRAKCNRVFSPAAPIDTLDLFMGRLDQLKDIVDAVTTRGQHAVVYGERGVGKTSLANVFKDMVPMEETGVQICVKVNCAQGDTFHKVWESAFAEAFQIREHSSGAREVDLLSELPQNFGPADVRRLLQRHTGEGREAVVIFDEFDRLRRGEDQQLFADTIKDLSDNSVRATVVLVGVADDVDSLTGWRCR